MSNPEQGNILKTRAKVWVAPYGTARPSPNLAADADWPAGWFRLGFTGAPLKLNLQDERMNVSVEEYLGDIDEYIIKEKASLQTELAEFTAEYLQLTKGNTITIVNAAAGQVGYEEIAIGNVSRMTKYAVGFEGIRYDEDDNALPVRVFHPRAVFRVNGESEFSQKTDSYTKLPIMISALADANNNGSHTLWHRVLAPAL